MHLKNSPLWSLQRALYHRLTQDEFLKKILGDPARIFDNPPTEAPFPYVTIGEGRSNDFVGVDGGMEHDVRLHVFSRYAGRRQVKQIIDLLYQALHEADLDLFDETNSFREHHLVNIRFVFSDIFRVRDGTIYQGVIRFRAVTQPVPQSRFEDQQLEEISR